MELDIVNASARHENESSQRRRRSSDGQDNISDLPDHIIGFILSFLTVVDAVRTCVLSKRWKNLWKFITELSFQDRHPLCHTKIKKTQFIQFVNRILFHLNSSTIDSFSLSFHYTYDNSYISEWISFVSNQRVKKMCFESQIQDRDFPSNPLFQCQSLEELVLKNLIIKVPHFISLSSLTSLKLSRTIMHFNLNEQKDLTLTFPVLRKFELEGAFTWLGMKSVTLHVPLVEVVSMDFGKYVRGNAEIKFFASRLTKFCYTGPFLSEIIFLDAVHIVSANIRLYGSSKNLEETMHFVSKLLSINAASLKLCLRSKKVLERVKHSFNDIPDFQTLGHLDLDFATSDFLFGLLLKSPCLETLVIKVHDFDDTQLNSTFMPGCFLFTLKVVKFERFVGTKHELNFAKYVITNALALERITFSCCPDLMGRKKLENVIEKIYSYKSFSPVVIEFLY